MSNILTVKENYVYLKSYGTITSDEVSKTIEKLSDIYSNQKISNILVDIRDHEEFNVSLYVFYEIIKKAPKMNVAFIIKEKQNSIDLFSIIKIIADVKLFKLQIFYNDEESKKWTENFK